MLQIVLLLSAILLTLTLIKEIQFQKKYSGYIPIDVIISPQNKILFAKLQKEYLNNISTSDIEQLNSFLTDYYFNRIEKEIENEKRKNRNTTNKR